MKNIDSRTHVRGESVYVDDILPIKNTLHAVVLGSPVAKGILHEIDISRAEAHPEVTRVITAKDVPGQNQIGGIIRDEPLLATDELHYRGQPVAVILATSPLAGRKARGMISLDITEEEPIVSAREAYEKGELIHPPRTFELGNVDSIWDDCHVILRDRVNISGQEHLYLETQGAYAFTTEDNHIRIISSTQGPTAVQRTTATVLGIPMHKVEVDVRRLGGGFGGKEDQATPWGVMAALGSQLTGMPVKLILDRHDDMYMTGKRHPYEADFTIGVDQQGRILAYEVTFYQNSGAAADLSPAVLERTLFHATNSYFIPNVRATGIPCRTNLPPNTAFRGFGGPQGMYVMEAAITKVAEELGMEAWTVQEVNLLREGDMFPYGQIAQHCQIRNTWNDAKRRYDFEQILEDIREYNEAHVYSKKGVALMPVSFGISFTNTSMNQAGSLVHIYQDGSVGVSTGAVEMGQGVNTRILQVPQRIFSIGPELVHIEATNTTRVANTSPSAASSTHDLNGKATQLACERLRERLLNVASAFLDRDRNSLTLRDGQVLCDGEPTPLSWQKLVRETYLSRTDLSEHAHYSTPDIHFDPTKEKGHPFAYHAFGTAIVIVTVDCIRGRYDFDAVRVSHDFGKSMNPVIDLGQMEGGIVQGLGWMTTEELRYTDQGILESSNLSTYKVPDLAAAPKEISTYFLEDSENDYGLFKSKAIGEPPLMYGIGGYFAIHNAIREFQRDAPLPFYSPMTPERVLTYLYPDFK